MNAPFGQQARAPHLGRPHPKDGYIESLQGPVVQVILTGFTSPLTGEAPRSTFHLPQYLVAGESIYFRNEILRLTKRTSDKTASSKSTTSTSSSKNGNDSASVTSPSPASSIPYISPHTTAIPTIILEGVASEVFGLFLKFLYQGMYPSDVGGTPTFGPGSTSTIQATNEADAPGLSELVPIHFLAWRLGQRLNAPRFQNHAFDHIHRSIGVHFSLTPFLVHWIWHQTALLLAATDPSTPSAPKQLRNFILDIMAVHWSGSTNHIARFSALENAWVQLFGLHQDLTMNFIFGLQSRRVLAHTEYWIDAPPGSPGVSTLKVPQWHGAGGARVGGIANRGSSSVPVGQDQPVGRVVSDSALATKAKGSKESRPIMKTEPRTEIPDISKVPLATSHRAALPIQTQDQARTHVLENSGLPLLQQVPLLPLRTHVENTVAASHTNPTAPAHQIQPKINNSSKATSSRAVSPSSQSIPTNNMPTSKIPQKRSATPTSPDAKMRDNKMVKVEEVDAENTKDSTVEHNKKEKAKSNGGSGKTTLKNDASTVNRNKKSSEVSRNGKRPVTNS